MDEQLVNIVLGSLVFGFFGFLIGYVAGRQL